DDWRTSCASESPSDCRAFLKGRDPRFLLAQHADRRRRNPRFTHSDLVYADKDRDRRSDLRPALRSWALRNERHTRGRYAAGLPSVAERARRTLRWYARGAAVRCTQTSKRRRTAATLTGRTTAAAEQSQPATSAVTASLCEARTSPKGDGYKLSAKFT